MLKIAFIKIQELEERIEKNKKKGYNIQLSILYPFFYFN